jgi:hypothetical protein
MLTYLDFSRNRPDTDALETTMWTRVQPRPGFWTPPHEVRDLVLDMRKAPVGGSGYFIGDYFGLASRGIGFAAVVPVPRFRADD